MIAFGFVIYFRIMSRICFSMSFGWSPTGTLVRPGKSTSVRVRTLGEKIRRFMGTGEIPAFFPVLASVSLTISSLILEKSWNFCPGRWRNSPHSSAFVALSPFVSMSTPLAVLPAGRWTSWSTYGRVSTNLQQEGKLPVDAASLFRFLWAGSLVLRCSLDRTTFR